MPPDHFVPAGPAVTLGMCYTASQPGQKPIKMLRTKKNVRIHPDWSTGGALVVSETDQVPQIKLKEKHGQNYLCAKIQTAELAISLKV